MKRMFLAVVAMLSMTMAVAENENTKEFDRSVYKLEVNENKLGQALNLTADQYENVRYAQECLAVDMMRAGRGKNDEMRKARLKKAIKRNVGRMHYVLNEDQFRLYLRLLNVTLNNRGLQY